MGRALCPELVKRSLEQDASGAESVRTITAGEMIDMTASGEGQREDVDDRGIEIESTTCRRAPRAPPFAARSTLTFSSSRRRGTAGGSSTWRGVTASRAERGWSKQATVPMEIMGRFSNPQVLEGLGAACRIAKGETAAS